MSWKKGATATIILVIVAIALASFSFAGIYLGTVEGYVKDVTGGTVSGASVSASVNGCSGGGCSGSATSDSGGYYVLANLNLPALGTASMSATKAAATGSASATADDYQAAYTNITICAPPSTPSLTPVSSSHNRNATFSWTSGSGAGSPYDEFKLDSGSTVSPATSPRTETGLSFASHTWYVRTCNTYCCSAWASNSFSITNSAPSAPTLTAEPDTNGTEVELNWSSGADSDGDLIYDQYQFNSGTIINATPPRTESNLSVGNYAWRVRSCDVFDYCSSWVEDSFLATGCAVVTTCPGGGGGGGNCPACPSCGGGAGGGGGATPVCEGSYKLVITVPPELKPGDHFNLGVSFESSINLGKVKFTVNDVPGISIPPYNLNSLCAKDEADFTMKGILSNSVEPKEYELTFNVHIDGALVITQKFKLGVSTGAVVEMPAEIPAANNLDIVTSVTKKLAKGERITFLAKAQGHSIFIIAINENSVELAIYSEPINLLVNLGETSSVDIDGDGALDISIRLNAITEDGNADLTVTEINPMPTKEILLISAGAFLTLLVIVLIVVYRLHAREKARNLFRQIRAIENRK